MNLDDDEDTHLNDKMDDEDPDKNREEFERMFETYLEQKKMMHEMFEMAREFQTLLYNEFFVNKKKYIIIPRKFKNVDNMAICLFKTEKIIESVFLAILN